MEITGSTALVTGANRGLGRALAAAFVRRGARTVYAGARDPADVSDPDVVPIRLDITDPAAVAAAARRCADVTILVNNAAIATFAPVAAPVTMETARREMETNYFGTLAMSQAFAPLLRGGALVNILSITSFFSHPGIGSLCATKAAAWSLTNSLRLELPDTLVVGVHASFIDTRLAAGIELPKHSPDAVADMVLDAVAAGRKEVLADERTKDMRCALGRWQE
jgi:NAD(P)-dependent dehydrogenase (short-subunit alcohol dehydrogenase family)